MGFPVGALLYKLFGFRMACLSVRSLLPQPRERRGPCDGRGEGGVQGRETESEEACGQDIAGEGWDEVRAVWEFNSFGTLPPHRPNFSALFALMRMSLLQVASLVAAWSAAIVVFELTGVLPLPTMPQSAAGRDPELTAASGLDDAEDPLLGS